MRCRNTEIHWSRHVTEEMFRTALFLSSRVNSPNCFKGKKGYVFKYKAENEKT